MKDAQAFKTLFLKYKKRLRYFANKMANDDFWSESFATDALMKVWNKHDFETEKETKNFLYTEVMNACLKYLRVYKPGKRFSETEITEFFMEAELLEEINVSKQIESSEKD